MPSQTKIIQGQNGKPAIYVGLRELEDEMRDGLRRASLFLGYTARVTSGAPLETVKLNHAVSFGVDTGVEDPIPLELRQRFHDEYRAWAIGMGLAELDQTYQRYVASALDTHADLEELLKGGNLLKHKPRLVNTSALHTSFYETLGRQSASHDAESRYLRSLGNARNCLAHDSGVVTPRRFTEGETMPVRWPGMNMVRIATSGLREILPLDQPVFIREEDLGATLSTEELVRETIYRDGDRIDLAAPDLAEIIFFYQKLAMQVSSVMHEWFRSVGRRRGINAIDIPPPQRPRPW